MEPEIACHQCGARLRLAEARRTVGRVELRCGDCGEVGSWPTTRLRTTDAHPVEEAPAPPAPPWT
jgi:hypothetical protein